MEKALLRPEECSEILGISRAKLYQLLANGEISSIKIGRARRIPAVEIGRWISLRLEEQTAEDSPLAPE